MALPNSGFAQAYVKAIVCIIATPVMRFDICHSSFVRWSCSIVITPS